MNLLRGVAAVAVLAGASVATALPAAADTPVMQGDYTYVDEGRTGTWTIFPTCVPIVGDLREPLYLPVGCTLHVTPSGGVRGGDARLTGGLWTYTTNNREGLQCPDGSWAPTTEDVSFNETSGTRRITHAGACGLQPGIIDVPFTLSFKAPLPIPVDQYPLICEPGGLRRCF
ncbi:MULTISPECIES: hypothetical protein [Mycolicibacterium]|uniref:Secreted protein n=3 Tax=Mycolicibacterium gilvum TaxID=1804 RepID=E6TFD6_MYCSR|nr:MULTISPECIES: hypothetical protein [Mycolicibacterium]ABP45239.1 conserved hypothetical protein [Mycolicibacterium gilvum PYR-GCK]ADT98852.1 hypothetical protein Mspyr1_22020 [Mycolicibacterium gilvum Spyr1]MBV5244481.1 hypothetical protein [Mycolicibacterium sp. PAM1]MCV7057618.1 hypothetical protein [Mycolicibacterium gilvum]STZ44446.1 putative secreted protein [Mycolicibacterium gilvum]